MIDQRIIESAVASIFQQQAEDILLRHFGLERSFDQLCTRHLYAERVNVNNFISVFKHRSLYDRLNELFNNNKVILRIFKRFPKTDDRYYLDKLSNLMSEKVFVDGLVELARERGRADAEKDFLELWRSMQNSGLLDCL